MGGSRGHINFHRRSRTVILKCGPQTCSISNKWELVKMQILGPQPRPEAEILGKGPSNLVFNKLSR